MLRIQRTQRSWLLENFRLEMWTILVCYQRNCSSEMLNASWVFKTVEGSTSCFSQLSLFLFLVTCHSHRHLIHSSLFYGWIHFHLKPQHKMPIPSRGVVKRSNWRKPMATFNITWKPFSWDILSVHGTGFHEDVFTQAYNVLRAKSLCPTPTSPLLIPFISQGLRLPWCHRYIWFYLST